MPTDCQTDVAAGRPRNCDLEAREDKLLNTAAALFMEKGYFGTSLEMIAREARVAVRTIYLASDTRPLMAVLTDFSMRFLDLVSAPESIALQRMVIAES